MVLPRRIESFAFGRKVGGEFGLELVSVDLTSKEQRANVAIASTTGLNPAVSDYDTDYAAFSRVTCQIALSIVPSDLLGAFRTT
jgi:hypothetical protein